MEILNMAVNLEKRVDNLERLVGQFVSQTGTALLRLERSLEDFKKEMSDFKDEMSDFKNEMRSQVLRMNSQWGDLAHRLGTVVEDLVFPSLDRIILEQYGVTTEKIMVRVPRKI